jgi:hypothetical protein
LYVKEQNTSVSNVPEKKEMNQITPYSHKQINNLYTPCHKPSGTRVHKPIVSHTLANLWDTNLLR